MHLICNKHTKKLFPSLTTLGAIACHTNLGINNLKVFSFSYIPLYIASQWVLEFNDPATAETYQVVVLSRRLSLVAMVGLIKMAFLYQAQLLECLQGSIDGRQAQAGLLFSCPAIEFVSI